MPSRPMPSRAREEEFAASPARVATALGAIVGLLLILAGIFWAGFTSGGWATAYYFPVITLGVGVLAAGFFVIFNFEWLGQVVTGRAALSGVLVAVMCVAALVFWAAGNYAFNYKGSISIRGRKVPLGKSWDLTRLKKFTLSERTLAQLAELKAPLRIVVIGRLYNPQDPQDNEANELVNLYKAASPSVSAEFLRPGEEDARVKVQKLADEMHRSPQELVPGSVALLYKDQFKYFQSSELYETRPRPFGGQVMPETIFKGEEVFTSAIYQMLDAKKRKIYFVEGHGEREFGAETREGLSFVGESLARANFETAKLFLPGAQKIPDDADLVVLCGPRKPVAETEAKVLMEYLDRRKGRILLCLDEFRPEADVGLDGFLAGLGVAAGRDRIVEPDRAAHFPQVYDWTFAGDYGFNPAVEALKQERIRVLFGPARSVRAEPEYRGDWRVDLLVSGGADSYGETDLQSLRSKGLTRYDEGADSAKPASYAVAVWEGAAPMPGGRMEKSLGRVLITGDSNWCTNMLMRWGQGNETFFMSAVHWLLGQEKRITIEPRKTDSASFFLSPAQKGVCHVTLAGIFVGLFLAAALVAWVRRR